MTLSFQKSSPERFCLVMILDEFEGFTVTQEPYHRNRTNYAHVHADLQYAPNRPAITIIQKQTDGLSETQAGQQVVGRQTAETLREGRAANV